MLDTSSSIHHLGTMQTRQRAKNAINFTRIRSRTDLQSNVVDISRDQTPALREDE